jgi:y4mF family transcriptional regulator
LIATGTNFAEKNPSGKFPWRYVFPGSNFPEREISLDRAADMLLFSRSGKQKVAKRIKTPADIGALVRLARKEQNLRQDELAGVAGVGLRFIVDLEAGKRTAQIGKVLQVLQTLGCSIDILAPGERRK